MKQFSEVLTKAIALNHKTQKQVAKDLNISISAISSYCRGVRQPDLSMLMRLQEYLNIPMEYIFSDDIDERIFKLDENELELLGSLKALNNSNREFFYKHTKELLTLLHSIEEQAR